MGGGDGGGSGRVGAVASGERRGGDRSDAGPDGGEVITEHAVRMTSGDVCVRNPHPDIERIYPLGVWIEGQQRSTRVFRRRVIVVEDWVDVSDD